ncbi:hypothetical protein K7432_009612 [Basidiobolus ranarum]|uniref:Uncharacterized protein n=1 Tax=Basidiobolus ranarum TaxID=34480 RepID=A0ABR2WQ17_9FUNG
MVTTATEDTALVEDTDGHHLQFAHCGAGKSVTRANVSATDFSSLLNLGKGALITNFLLSEEAIVTPEEGQLRRIKARKLIRRLSTFKKIKKHLHKKNSLPISKGLVTGEKEEVFTGEPTTDSPPTPRT